MFRKLIRPPDGRKSRLRDARNELVPMSRLIMNGPRSLVTYILFRLFDYRPTQPWIAFDAIRKLDGYLNPSMRVLEYGSGMSTVWLARRAGSVISVESDASWAAFQRRKFSEDRVHNVQLVEALTKDAYVRPQVGGSELARGSFDFVLVDGLYRDDCARAALEFVKPGGWVYVDNTDVRDFNELTGNLDDARSLLSDEARRRGGSVEKFVDFAPGLLFPTTGHMFAL